MKIKRSIDLCCIEAYGSEWKFQHVISLRKVLQDGADMYTGCNVRFVKHELCYHSLHGHKGVETGLVLRLAVHMVLEYMS